MARGNNIIVSSAPAGRFEEGIIATAEKPGTIMQRDASVALKSGRHTYIVATPGANGEQPKGAYWVLLPNSLIGSAADVAYAAGDRGFLYSPQPGDELNLLMANVAGTADDHALGEKMMVESGTGKLIATTGSPEVEIFQLLEAVTDPTADQLVWGQWSGL
jgi:hypothetical protein